MKSTVFRETGARSAILQLEQFLPYLFHLITAGLSNRFLERLRENGVTVNRWRVLMVIMSKGPRNMTELVKLTLIPQSALSRLIDQMERDRLVVRRPSREDSRRVEVELTDHGRQMYWRLVPTAETHAAIIVDGFGEDERLLLDKLLRRVLANLQIDALSGVDPDDDTSRTASRALRKAATSARPTKRRRPRRS